MWGHETLRGQTADNILLLKRRVAPPTKCSENNTPNMSLDCTHKVSRPHPPNIDFQDNDKDKKGASKDPLSILLSPPLGYSR